jgi:hypothetical protein
MQKRRNSSGIFAIKGRNTAAPLVYDHDFLVKELGKATP